MHECQRMGQVMSDWEAGCEQMVKDQVGERGQVMKDEVSGRDGENWQWEEGTDEGVGGGRNEHIVCMSMVPCNVFGIGGSETHGEHCRKVQAQVLFTTATSFNLCKLRPFKIGLHLMIIE